MLLAVCELCSGLFTEDSAEGGEDILYGVVALYLAVVAVALVVGDQGLGLVVIGGNAVFDDAAVSVVLAALDPGAVQDALEYHAVRKSEGKDRIYLASEFRKHGIKGLCLGNGAGKAVEKESGYVPVGCYLVADHAFYHLVRNKVPSVDELGCFLSEFGAGGHLLAQEVTGGEVEVMVFLDYLLGLGAFAGSRRTEKDVIFHNLYS